MTFLLRRAPYTALLAPCSPPPPPQLCRTYDAAECCRNVHVDPAWRAAAGRACVQLGGEWIGAGVGAGVGGA